VADVLSVGQLIWILGSSQTAEGMKAEFIMDLIVMLDHKATFLALKRMMEAELLSATIIETRKIFWDSCVAN